MYTRLDLLFHTVAIPLQSFFERKPQVILDYQSLKYDIATDSYTMNVKFDVSKECWMFKIEFFSEDEILTNGFNTPHTPYVSQANNSVIELSSSNFNFTDADHETYFRVIAVTDKGEQCSDDISSNTFYRFLRNGML